MNKLTLLTLLAAWSLPSWGATVNSNTVTFNFTSASSVLSFDQFDTGLGTLTRVEIVFLTGSHMFTSGTPNDPFSGGCGGNFSFTASVNPGSVVTSVGFGSGSLTSSTCGISTFTSNSFFGPRTISNSTNLNLFEGTGTIDFDLGRGPITLTNITAASVRFDGDARLRYTYDPAPEVPEPSTSALLGGCLLAGILARRLGISRRIS
ncbi:MAG: choice-of-anchor E domain-containing protein [Bryobacteraceae bacterium]